MAAQFYGHPEGTISFARQTAEECMKLAREQAEYMHPQTIKSLGINPEDCVWMYRLHELDRGELSNMFNAYLTSVDIKITAYPVTKKTRTGSQLYVWQAKKHKFIPDAPKTYLGTGLDGTKNYVSNPPTSKAWASTCPKSFIQNYVWRKRAQFDIHRKIANRAEAAFLSLASTEWDSTRIDPTL